MVKAREFYPKGKLVLRELGLRDGLQLTKSWPGTSAKKEWIRRAHDAGVRHFEVGSFLSKNRFPQFADIRDLVETVSGLPGARSSALTLNERATADALETDVDEIIFSISATEEHSLANINRTRAEAVNLIRKAVEMRGSAPKPLISTAISMAFGCSISGEVAVDSVVELIESCIDAGAEAIGVADTVGYAGPMQICRNVPGGSAQDRRHPSDHPLARHQRNRPVQRVRGASIGRQGSRRDAGRTRRVPVRARRDGQRRIRGSGLPLRTQRLPNRNRSAEVDRSQENTRGGTRRRDAPRRTGESRGARERPLALRAPRGVGRRIASRPNSSRRRRTEKRFPLRRSYRCRRASRGSIFPQGFATRPAESRRRRGVRVRRGRIRRGTAHPLHSATSATLRRTICNASRGNHPEIAFSACAPGATSAASHSDGIRNSRLLGRVLCCGAKTKNDPFRVMGQPVRLLGRTRQLQHLQSRASPFGKPVQQGLDFFPTGFRACFRFMGRKLPLREPAKIIRASGIRPNSGQALAAERLRADR